jgi:hypothetical protein
MGYPSYEECAAMAAILGVYEVLGVPLPTQLAWKIGPWESRLREWVKREVERGNLGKLTGACAERPPLSRSSAPSHGKRN